MLGLKKKPDPIVVSFPWEGTSLTWHGPDGARVEGWWIFHRIIDGSLHSFSFPSKEEAEKSDTWDTKS